MNFDPTLPPTAPTPMEYMRPHPENIGFSAPPTAPMATCPSFTEEQVLNALDDYVSGECSYRDKFVKEMKIRDIMATPIYGYAAEFFIEKRTKEWVTEPYRGEYVQPEQNYAVPVDIWSVPMQTPPAFTSGKQQMSIPGSISIVNCAQCTGIGNIQCGTCAGSMKTACTGCNATGTQEIVDKNTGESRRVTCIKCKGMKRTKCDNCKGKGTAICKTCQGFRRVKNHEIMDVVWSTVTETSHHKKLGEVKINKGVLVPLKKKLVGEVISGSPVDIPPYPCFRKVFDSNYTKHCGIPHQRVLNIRQRVFLYPGSEVISAYKNRDIRFLIFGEEHVVYFPQGYPTTCCIIL